MIRVTAYFKNTKLSKLFDNVYDAIEFKDSVDAHYPLKVTFEKGVYPMKEWIYNNWNLVMDMDHNPLKNIPDTNTRHMVLQVLAWMWCIVFALMVGSWTAFGVSAVGHILLLGAIAVTVATFEMAKKNPSAFSLRPGYHSVSRTRQTMWINGEKFDLDPRDPGGEHE